MTFNILPIPMYRDAYLTSPWNSREGRLHWTTLLIARLSSSNFWLLSPCLRARCFLISPVSFSKTIGTSKLPFVSWNSTPSLEFTSPSSCRNVVGCVDCSSAPAFEAKCIVAGVICCCCPYLSFNRSTTHVLLWHYKLAFISANLSLVLAAADSRCDLKTLNFCASVRFTFKWMVDSNESQNVCHRKMSSLNVGMKNWGNLWYWEELDDALLSHLNHLRSLRHCSSRWLSIFSIQQWRG